MINALRSILNFLIVLAGIMVIGFLLALLLVGLFGGKA